MITAARAYALALDYVQKHGVVHYGCAYKGIWRSRYVRAGAFGPTFPSGQRREIWYFQFALEPPPEPNVVVSGGTYVVCVDGETGLCGALESL